MVAEATDIKDTYFMITAHLNTQYQRLDFIYSSKRHKKPVLKIDFLYRPT
jgi:hypothetical protein